jgi:hypothetical protein
MEDEWVEGYYQALDFYLGEPQHLARTRGLKSPRRSRQEVIRGLRQLEVPLNHIMHQFFSLAPNSFRNELFAKILDREIPGKFVIVRRDVDVKYDLKNAMQPDFSFIADDTTVSIEMKIKAKSSVSQVLKYCLFCLAVETRDKKIRSHYLGFVGKGGFSNLWVNGFIGISTGQLGESLTDEVISSFLAKQAVRFKEQSKRFAEIVSSLTIGYISYEGFEDLLSKTKRDQLDGSAGAEVYRKLLRGMIEELRSRGLRSNDHG